MLEEFGQIVAPGGAVFGDLEHGRVYAATGRRSGARPGPHLDRRVAGLRILAPDAVPNSGAAYALAKRANHLRVQSAALAWGDRGARVNSISPGIILTPLAQQEMGGEGGPGYRAMIDASAAGRVGTTGEIATAAAYLLGPDAGFITGADLLIEGGVIAALHAGRLQVHLR